MNTEVIGQDVHAMVDLDGQDVHAMVDLDGQDVHAMVDLETLATSIDASIASLGATAWQRRPYPCIDLFLRPELKLLINIANQPTRRFDGATILWWLRQSKEAQEATFGKGAERLGLRPALTELYNWAVKLKVTHWWSWPAQYDLALLDHAYAQFEMQAPWKRKNLNCARTICSFLKVQRNPNPLKHDPLEDARVQADAVRRAFALVDKGKK
jgi:hypothetical protein